ncbi:hypothetical protein KsCSTR_25540 [Candidatus Kuenenia stuttgartiensis]|uniref:Uncharacterized protein n=1 Tax=Kuenenia stuttgartiensis TaxID=174633 RepID=Q1PXA4_KUEST|nr:hypothetical protein KsCSTR_25540 [Candidatus Kuenenia stuttgartiensis]CAJ71864.1 unknown protein [Candidatus Kuenenia stuttgartiensis]CAJ75265.1 unknown protein [Candidatus Kuenenia stuttgartiensis]
MFEGCRAMNLFCPYLVNLYYKIVYALYFLTCLLVVTNYIFKSGHFCIIREFQQILGF